jgi:hypothetical protein
VFIQVQPNGSNPVEAKPIRPVERSTRVGSSPRTPRAVEEGAARCGFGYVLSGPASAAPFTLWGPPPVEMRNAGGLVSIRWARRDPPARRSLSIRNGRRSLAPRRRKRGESRTEDQVRFRGTSAPELHPRPTRMLGTCWRERWSASQGRCHTAYSASACPGPTLQTRKRSRPRSLWGRLAIAPYHRFPTSSHRVVLLSRQRIDPLKMLRMGSALDFGHTDRAAWPLAGKSQESRADPNSCSCPLTDPRDELPMLGG